MNDNIAEKLLLNLLEKSVFVINQKWLDSKFFIMKQISNTEKGDIAEDFLADALKQNWL